MKLAIVTPLPPQKTGIADYAADLITGLEKTQIEIDLFSNAEIEKFQYFKVFNPEKIDPGILNKYDLIIYQMGNNIHFHLYMIELIKNYRGIVHLHDMVLHHTFAWITLAQGNRHDYFKKIEKWYGTKVKKLVKKMISAGAMPWDTEIVTEIPMFEEFIQYADACIVHSEFVKERIKSCFPKLNVYKVDQLYKMSVPKKKAPDNKSDNKVVKFGILGGVDPQKKVDLVLKSFAQVSKKHGCNNFHLIIVGGIDKRCKYIQKLPKKYQIDDSVKITGRVSRDDFFKYFSDIDVLIALRNPTMGETSAIVMRAMQLGIPSIVSDIGWYHELPLYVKKISIHNSEEELENTIVELLKNKQSLKDFLDNAIWFSEKKLDFENYLNQYSSIIKQIYKVKLNTVLYGQLSPVMDDLSCLDNPAVYTPVINKLIDIFG